MARTEIHIGRDKSFHWLTSTEDYSGTLLRVSPEVFLGRHLAVTCVDGGAMRLTESQQAAGWDVRQGIGYSPKLDRVDDVPYQLDGPDGAGYDEYYIFEDPHDLGERSHNNMFLEQFAPVTKRTVVFVTWAAFTLNCREPAVQSLAALFWRQLRRLNPESYIADGMECLTFISRNAKLFQTVHASLTELT